MQPICAAVSDLDKAFSCTAFPRQRKKKEVDKKETLTAAVRHYLLPLNDIPLN